MTFEYLIQDFLTDGKTKYNPRLVNHYRYSYLFQDQMALFLLKKNKFLSHQ